MIASGVEFLSSGLSRNLPGGALKRFPTAGADLAHSVGARLFDCRPVAFTGDSDTIGAACGRFGPTSLLDLGCAVVIRAPLF